MESLEKVLRHYRRMAPAYDLLVRLGIWPPGLRARAVAALELRAGDRVLDVGCGTGGAFPLIARAVGPGSRVVGVEYTPEMLGRAARARHARCNVLLVRADAAQLPLAGEFDAALFCLSCFVIPNWPAALDAAWLLLHPGGRLVVADGKIPITPGERFASPRLESFVNATRFAPLLASHRLPALRHWLAQTGARAVWKEWFAGLFFLCQISKD